MRSVGARLTLSFVLVTFIATVLVAGIAGRGTLVGFTEFLTNNGNNGQPANTDNRQQTPQPQQTNNNNNGGRNDNGGGNNDNDRRSRPRQFEAGTPAGIFEDSVTSSLLIGILAGTGLATIVGLLLTQTLIRPIRSLTRATQQLADGNLGHQVKVRRADEIGELATAFNQMSADLAQSNHLRQQLTADIAHDIRTPLTVIAGYTEGLRDGKFAATSKTFGVMHDQVQLLQHLLDDLRTLSLADANELSLTKRLTDPRALLERAAVSYIQQAEAREVTISLSGAEQLPTVNVDIERMAQVLNNLVSNALRYTPVGGEITLSGESTESHAILRVQDTGSGIDAANLPYIFERFYRADQARARTEVKSSGLGLAIAKAIVDGHGGKISAESTPGKGSTFTISLPTA